MTHLKPQGNIAESQKFRKKLRLQTIACKRKYFTGFQINDAHEVFSRMAIKDFFNAVIEYETPRYVKVKPKKLYICMGIAFFKEKQIQRALIKPHWTD